MVMVRVSCRLVVFPGDDDDDYDHDHDDDHDEDEEDRHVPAGLGGF